MIVLQICWNNFKIACINDSNINKLERKINKLTTVEENSIIIFSQSLIDQAHKNLGKIQISKLNLMLKKENSASNS